MTAIRFRIWFAACSAALLVAGCSTNQRASTGVTPSAGERHRAAASIPTAGPDESTDPANATCILGNVTCVIQGGSNSIAYDIDVCPTPANPPLCALVSFTVAASPVPSPLLETFSPTSGPADTIDTFTLSAPKMATPGTYSGSVWTLVVTGGGNGGTAVEKPTIQVLCSVNLGTCLSTPGPYASYKCIPQPPAIDVITGIFAVRRRPEAASSSTPSPTPPPQLVLVPSNADGSCTLPTAMPAPTPTPTPSATPKPPCGVTSETAATVPANRSRKTIGVDEIVTLTANGEDITWALNGIGSIDEIAGSTTVFTADDYPGASTITASGSNCSSAATVFNVIEPTGIVDVRVPGSGVRHTRGVPNIGMRVDIYFQPDTVSFSRLTWLESEVGCVCTGYYKLFSGRGHGPNPRPLGLLEDVPGLGTMVNGFDTAYSGATYVAKQYPPGEEIYNIPTNYVGKGGARIMFTTARQTVLLSDAPSQHYATQLTISKAGAHASADVFGASSHYDELP
jgi:hypothetical protein